MEASRAEKIRSLLLYGGVIVGLLVIVIFGVLWAKNRADYYASRPQAPITGQQNGQPQGGTQPDEDKNDDKDQQPAPAQPSPQPASPPAPATAPSTGRVPATGPEDFLLMSLALGATAFAFVRYMQARRRLLTY